MLMSASRSLFSVASRPHLLAHLTWSLRPISHRARVAELLGGCLIISKLQNQLTSLSSLLLRPLTGLRSYSSCRRSSPTSLAPWSNGSFGDDSPFADSPYEGPMAGSLPLDGAFSLKSPQSNIPVKNKMSEFTLPQTIDEYVEIGDKTDDVFSEIRAQFHPAFWNLSPPASSWNPWVPLCWELHQP